MILKKVKTLCEASARFVVDESYWRGRAIALDWRAGVIDQSEAIRRNLALENEANTYRPFRYTQYIRNMNFALYILTIIFGFVMGVEYASKTFKKT